jgi:FkbM family methyltransferase
MIILQQLYREALFSLYRTLRPVVDGLHLHKIARPIWAMLWNRDIGMLITAKHGDRCWQLDSRVALDNLNYEPATVAWLRKTIRPGMHVVDVGANVGLLVLEMAELAGPQGKILAIEPSPGNFQVLKQHVEANGFAERVILVHAACCSGMHSVITLEIPGGNIKGIENGPQVRDLQLKRLPANLKRTHKQVVVAAATIDKLCSQYSISPSVIKIDVEGAELAVFQGAKDTLKKYKPNLIFGFHPFAFHDSERARRAIESILTESGLQVRDSLPDQAWTLAEYCVEAP